MTQLVPVTLLNAASAGQVFSPVSRDVNLTRFQSDTGATVALRPVVSLSMREGKLGLANRVSRVKRKVTIKLSVPFQPAVVDLVTPALDTVEIVVNVMVPLDATDVTINDAVAYVQSFLSDALTDDVIVNGRAPY